MGVSGEGYSTSINKAGNRKLAGRVFFTYPPFSGRDFLKAPRRVFPCFYSAGTPSVTSKGCSSGIALGHFGENLCISKGTKEEGFEDRDAVSTPVCRIVPLSSWGSLHPSAWVPESCLPSPTLQSFVSLFLSPTLALLLCSLPTFKVRTSSCKAWLTCRLSVAQRASPESLTFIT